MNSVPTLVFRKESRGGGDMAGMRSLSESYLLSFRAFPMACPRLQKF